MMPAQQWISSGAWPFQVARECQQRVDMRTRRRRGAGSGIDDVVDTELQMPDGGKPGGVSIMCSGDNRLTRCEGAWVDDGVLKTGKRGDQKPGHGLFFSSYGA